MNISIMRRVIVQIILAIICTVTVFGFAAGLPMKRASRGVHFDPTRLKEAINLGGLYYSVCSVNSTAICSNTKIDDVQNTAQIGNRGEQVDGGENRQEFDWLVEMLDMCEIAYKILAFENLETLQRLAMKQFIQNAQSVSTLMARFYGMPKFCRGAKIYIEAKGIEEENELGLCDWTRVFCSRLEGKNFHLLQT